MEADIMIKDRSGKPKAIVEVKNKENLTAEAASFFFRNMMSHGLISTVPYFLMISQDIGFLWDDFGSSTVKFEPKLQFEMRNVVNRYLPQLNKNRLSGSELEFLVIQWFMDLTVVEVPTQTEPERSLGGLGFLDKIRGGLVVSGAQA